MAEKFEWPRWTEPQRGRRLLSALLRTPAERFEADYWLRKPYLQQLSTDERAAVLADPSHWVHVVSVATVRALLRRRRPHPARWLKDVDATKYDARGGRRQALAEGDGEVDAEGAWSAFESRGFSLRLVHPQQWHGGCFRLCALLQEHFGFATGCAAYLTPAGGSQGFPPHFDDVEVFVLQLEGAKRWRLYTRPNDAAAPGACVTTEFAPDALGEPTAELELRPGDVLYLPRGVVHQAVSLDDSHSLHLTVSTYQRHRWRDVLAHVLSPAALRALDALDGARAGGWVHAGVPTSLLDAQVAGRPHLARARLGPFLRAQRLPAAIAAELAADGALERALDAAASAFLFDSLPPPGPPPPPPPRALRRSTLVRLRAPRCAWLLDVSAADAAARGARYTRGSLEAWEGGRGAAPRLELRTNVCNGRSFESPASPAFEVLPTLARSVLQLLDAPWPRAIAVGRLAAAAPGCSKRARADLRRLLDVLLEHGVLVMKRPLALRGG
ncbi:hypothetical protein KFE25_002145 [Diacronema lutheri]|uniref:Bifunctional lysine-specific demethylase and histidyl-hydroxylase n=1 Tax=Diacronema lutheri TaxID=2081491 RepID=A0A8J6CBB5_DIALT|nr:hypothetical protein KFE25_002145 [Diacronema lutheri]